MNVLRMVVLLALVGVLGAGWLAPEASVCQENPSPVDEADPDIIVTSPGSGDSVASPLTAAGEARTFEATVQVALFDVEGTEIASTHGMATPPDAGQLGPFSIDLAFSVAETTEGCLWVFEDSAETGEPINVVQLPLTLEPTSLPSTGAAGPDTSGSAATVLVAVGVAGTVALAGGAWYARRRLG